MRPVLLALALAGPPSGGSASLGKELFMGSAELTGRVREHQGAMPPSAVVCAHCHAAQRRAAVKNSSAPALRADFLTGRITRRHGPPSAYDNQSFCRVLRTGVDPAYVLVDRSMPVYEISDAECHSIWLFLTGQR